MKRTKRKEDRMNYDDFLKQAVEDIRKAFPESEVQIRNVEKLQNESYRGISVGPKGAGISAVFNLEPPFRKMQEGAYYGDVMEELVSTISRTLRDMPSVDIEKYDSYEAMRERVGMEVISKEANAEMLEGIPHRDLLDMAVVCRFHMGEREDGSSVTTLVTNDMLSRMGVEEQTLFADAMRIAPERRPLEIVPLYGMLQAMDPDGGLPPEEPDGSVPIYVCTTGDRTHGAGVIAYPDFMEQASKAAKGDFFLLPSSIHEVLILPDNGTLGYRELQDMVREVNATQVAPWEKLTDNVYHYDAKERIFETGEQFAERSLQKAFAEEHRSVLGDLKESRKACDAMPKPEKKTTRQRGEAVL